MDRAIARLRNGLQIDGRDETISSKAITVYLQDADGKILMAGGADVPTDATAGYAKGCIFIQTDGGVATTFYVNEGSNTSCDFNVSAGGAATTFVALTDTPANYSGAANKIVKVNDGATALEFVTPSGSVAMSSAGVFSIVNDTIINEDIKSDAAIAFSKLAALPSAQILVGSAGNVAAAVAMSGDAAISNAGAVTVTDLTIASEAQGDILYFNGTNWVRLAAGTNGYFLKTQGAGANPIWAVPEVGIANAIANGAILADAGAFDAVLAFTQQTVAQPTLTIPDFAGVSDTFVFKTKAETLANKTLTSPVLVTPQINNLAGTFQYVFAPSALAADRNVTLPLLTGDDEFVFKDFAQTLTNKTLSDSTTAFGAVGALTKALKFLLSGATADKTMTIASVHTDDRTLTLPDATDTLVGKATTDVLSNKTLADDSVKFADQADNTKDLFFSLGGATANKTMTIESSQTDDRTLTLPDATDTLVGKATTDVLTNKSIDADGAGNVITNINGDELDPITAANGTYGIPIIIPIVNAGSADINVFSGNVPFKLRVIDAWAVSTKAGNAGTWKLTDGTDDITDAIAYDTNDKEIARVHAINDAKHEFSGKPLHLINTEAADSAIVYVSVIRIA